MFATLDVDFFVIFVEDNLEVRFVRITWLDSGGNCEVVRGRLD